MPTMATRLPRPPTLACDPCCSPSFEESHNVWREPPATRNPRRASTWNWRFASSEISRLDAEDVSPQRGGSALVRIRRSKTDQYGQGAVLHVCRDAAERLKHWMTMAGIESGPLFRPVKGGSIETARLGPGAVRATIKRRAAQAGIGRRTSGHSLRVGSAQSLAERGVSLAELQVIGRWTSPAMPGRYVRGQEASRGAVARLRRRKRNNCRKRLKSAKR